mmetsp:Transcript_19093/g.31954  ORF Transcript_19093/g.31954 Transcript_19093/m.31954 type:complete len:407 (+) Transcript_19093:132-1352(+)
MLCLQYHVLLCYLALVIGGASEKTHPKKQLIALVHPGPGKTGSTHFQTFLVQEERALLKNNIAIWPELRSSYEKCVPKLVAISGVLRSRVKALASYHTYYKTCPQVQETLRSFINSSSLYGRHIILSSESLQAGDKSILNILDMLTAANYQIHGLFSYRFHMNWFISRYGEHIKTHSLSSKLYVRHSDKIEVSLFSDYLRSHWDLYMNHHSVDQFYEVLSKYPGFDLSIIDLYGTSAAGKVFEAVALCDATGLLCENSIFSKSKTITAHESETQDTIYARQGVLIFDHLAKTLNCTINTELNSKGKKFLYALMPRWNVTACPLRSVNISSYTQKSIDFDQDVRRRYEQHFIYGNATANELKVNPLPVVQEVDPKESMKRGSPCHIMMRSYLSEARKQGLCKKLLPF